MSASEGVPAWRRERRARRDEEDVRVMQKLDGLERAVGDRQRDHRQVELAPLQTREKQRVVADFVEADLRLRTFDRHRLEQLRQDARADALVRADLQAAVDPVLECVDVGRCRGHARDDRVGMAKNDFPDRGEGRRPLTAAALQQAVSDHLLERRHLLADRRLAVPEATRRLAERSFLRDCLERSDLTKLQTDESLSVPVRNCHRYRLRRIAAGRVCSPAGFGQPWALPSGYTAPRRGSVAGASPGSGNQRIRSNERDSGGSSARTGTTSRRIRLASSR